MAWPPTEHDILEVARDSNLTAGVTIQNIPFAGETPAKTEGRRVAISDGHMAEVKVSHGDPFVLVADKFLAIFDPKYMEPLVGKGLLTKQVGEHCTLYTLTEAGHYAVNACN